MQSKQTELDLAEEVGHASLLVVDTNKSWTREVTQLVKGLILRTHIKVKGGN